MFDGFLNKKSMLTPGVAALIIVGIVNVLWVNFGWPPKWTALLLSYLFLLLMPTPKIFDRWIKRIVCYFFNGLIIYCTAIGLNTAGLNQIHKSSRCYHVYSAVHSSQSKNERPFFSDWFCEG